MSIQTSEIYSNTASLSAGFENHSGNATVPVVLQTSNLYQNHADVYGGAIGNYGTLAISTTTLDSNSAVTRGGGIYNYEGGQIDMKQSTLSRNTAQTGGGIYSEFFIHNTAVADADEQHAQRQQRLAGRRRDLCRWRPDQSL